jgi:hypothetical protein
MKDDNTLIIVIVIIFAVFLVGGFGMMGFPFGMGMMSGFYGGFGMGFFGWLFMILVVVALGLLIIWLIKQIQKK